MRLARRISQVAFFVLFLFLFLQARFPYETWLPSDLFLRSSPLVAISMLASWTMDPKLMMGLVILLLAIPFGRFFCGWICPLGTTCDITDKLFKKKISTLHKKDAGKFRSWKFYILIAVLVSAFLSVPLAWFFDPIVLITRTTAIVLYPVFVFLSYGFFNLLFRTGVLENQVYTVYDWTRSTVLPIEQPTFINGTPILLLFLGIIVLGLFARRFWCANLCPLGALLGVFSKYRFLQRIVDDSCTSCGVCQHECRMNAVSTDYRESNAVECIECGECVAACPSRSISFKLSHIKKKKNNTVDLSRRQVIYASLTGIAGAAFLKVNASASSAMDKVIRPPGARAEKDFLEKCIRCQACSRICASTGGCLQPSLLEAGWEGLWSPVVVPRLGYCEYNCNLCGRVCPTGAIRNLALEDKQNTKIGRAWFDKNRCIPWVDSKDCLVCEEHCPVPDKAIKFDVREIQDSEGHARTVKLPFVVPELCIGCGICETKCPVTGDPGIFITPAGQSRTNLNI